MKFEKNDGGSCACNGGCGLWESVVLLRIFFVRRARFVRDGATTSRDCAATRELARRGSNHRGLCVMGQHPLRAHTLGADPSRPSRDGATPITCPSQKILCDIMPVAQKLASYVLNFLATGACHKNFCAIGTRCTKTQIFFKSI